MVKIIAFSGSLRKGSFNRLALNNAIRLAPEDMEIEIIDLIDIPLYNGDVEEDGYPESVKALAEKIKSADGVLISSPEYSGYFSGVLKNTLDWLSRSGLGNVLEDKHLAVMGVSDGHYGTDKSQQHLKSLAIELGMKPFNRPKIRIYNGPDMFDESGILKDERFSKNIINLLNELKSRIESDSS